MPKPALPVDFVDAMTVSTADTVEAISPAKTRKARKASCAFRIDPELLARARDIAYWLSGPPECLGLVDLVERGLEHEIRRLEKKHNEGRPFPAREG